MEGDSLPTEGPFTALILKYSVPCPRCDEWPMKKRMGPYGEFYVCPRKAKTVVRNGLYVKPGGGCLKNVSFKRMQRMHGSTSRGAFHHKGVPTVSWEKIEVPAGKSISDYTSGPCQVVQERDTLFNNQSTEMV